MAGLVLIEGPEVEPLSIDEAKEMLRVTISDEDSFIGSLIVAARSMCEARSGRKFITATYQQTLDGFPPYDTWKDYGALKTAAVLQRAAFGSPTGINGILPYIIYPLLSPVQEVVSVKYFDTNGVEQTLSAGSYQVDVKSATPRIAPSFSSGVWPDTRTQLNAVTIEMTVGYGDTADDVPAQVKQAIRLLVAHWYANREAVVVGSINSQLELALDSLLWQLKNVRFQ